MGEEAELDPSTWEYDERDDAHGCGNCGGEGVLYGCSWEWQCDTWDESEGTCLCTRRCDWCRPTPRNPGLDQALSEALSQAKDPSHAD